LREAQRLAMIYDDQYNRDTKWNRNYFKKTNLKPNTLEEIEIDRMEIDNISSRAKQKKYSKVCYSCQKEGHFASKCPNKSKN